MMSDQSIAVLGASGQVARALQRAAKMCGMPIVVAGRPAVDINDLASLGAFFTRQRPGLVINAAAYTAVDKAESDVDAARSANEEGPARIAALCAMTGAPLVHISTDYVFDGMKTTPYVEDDARAPLSVYGKTKSAGEDAVSRTHAKHVIVRTAWVYSPEGQNFLKTMLRLGAERDVIRVVADQHGTPTSADDLASALLDIARQVQAQGERAPFGTYHLTAGGETTWHGFATEIFARAAAMGQKVPRLEAITTAEYPTPAPRPRYSVLNTTKVRDAFDISLPPWQTGVAQCLERLDELRAGEAYDLSDRSRQGPWTTRLARAFVRRNPA